MPDLEQDHFVQLCELRKNGLLGEFARKNDFGCRIRNACVVGSCPGTLPDSGGADSDLILNPPPAHPTIKSEHGQDHQPGPSGFPSSTPPGPQSTQLPPELLMLVLETGDLVLLFTRPVANGGHKLVTSRFGLPRHLPPQLGFHMAVDPSSRYVALACPTDAFVVYDLESHDQLNERRLRNEPLRPIRSFRLRNVRGVIHKMTFLYPGVGDDRHIILLLVVVRHGKSNIVIYDWDLGDDLKTALAEERPGHRMPVEDQMPLLLIPLTVQSAFVVVSPDRVSVCFGCLHGPPDFQGQFPAPDPTPNHRGRQPPLWTAWTRPVRQQWYNEKRDSLYLAREDGLVVFVEFEGDFLSILFSNPFPSNISTAFTCIFDGTTDVLFLGNDSGPGAYWKVRKES